VSTAYLSLGSNVGKRLALLRQALIELEARGVVVKKVSPIYETVPVGFSAQPKFLNAACSAETYLEPRQLLRAIAEVESVLGRVRTFPDAPRTIDVDILFYDDRVVTTRHLVIPHPRIVSRAFVLAPLADIAPELVHPQLGLKVRELLANIGGGGNSCKRIQEEPKSV
jgi:2-amino-4-hydroxy-6-hydroxymethyldihydropteridine diphosphokinase